MTARTATVGVVEHGNAVVLVTIASDGVPLDRRKVDLTEGLPTHPHHHEGSWAVGRYRNTAWAREVTLDEAIALIERVREAAKVGAKEILDALAGAVGRADHADRHSRVSRTAADHRRNAFATTGRRRSRIP